MADEDEGDQRQFPFVEDDDQKLRCFIASHYLNAEIDGVILIDNMDKIFTWIKDGTKASTTKTKPKLVKSE